ncbi:MAG: hypothetical protein QOI17_513 [Gaiellales bacterium]|jgi:uncharacterized membrane protein YoaK (UPF0700 family)|nr:hypothetical protein [Gaiellales bacterium]
MLVVLREAWRTVVPNPGDRHGPLPPAMLGLTVLTGLVDAFSYLVLGHVFVANMTGNVVFVGFALAAAPGFSLAGSLVVLAAFALGALFGGRVAHRARAHRGRVLYWALVLECVLVVAGYVIAQTANAPYGAGVRYPLIVLLGLGMGVQNAAARALAVPDMTTTVLTMTITGIASDSRLAGGTNSNTGRRVLAALAMLLGALLGALAIQHGHTALPLLLAALLLAVGTGVASTLARSDGAWTNP